MERAGALINRLQEQYQQNAGAEKLLVTVHILAAELELEKSKMAQNAKSVSVVAPSFLKRATPAEDTTFATTVNKPAAPPIEVKYKPADVFVPQTPTPVVAKATPAATNNQPVKVTQATMPRQQTDGLELNDTIAHGHKEESLNERLKTTNADLGSVLQQAPVQDLKKAIGINDRYVFLNELFKGDEAMYERSIKTINAFTIFAEAEYWIKRELKTKLGWSESAAPVIQFDLLVKRRFS